MCDIAPFSMRCEWEDVKDDLVSCSVHHLCCAVQELKMSLPIIGGWFGPYKCPSFEPKKED